MKREKLITKIPMSYLWFINVDPLAQDQEIGSKILQESIDYSNNNNRTIYLETSTVKNLPWYKKFRFEVYNEQELTYHLYFFKRDVMLFSITPWVGLPTITYFNLGQLVEVLITNIGLLLLFGLQVIRHIRAVRNEHEKLIESEQLLRIWNAGLKDAVSKRTMGQVFLF